MSKKMNRNRRERTRRDAARRTCAPALEHLASVVSSTRERVVLHPDGTLTIAGLRRGVVQLPDGTTTDWATSLDLADPQGFFERQLVEEATHFAKATTAHGAEGGDLFDTGVSNGVRILHPSEVDARDLGPITPTATPVRRSVAEAEDVLRGEFAADYALSPTPSEAEFEEMRAEAKRRKYSLAKIAGRHGYELVDEFANAQVRESWRRAPAAVVGA